MTLLICKWKRELLRKLLRGKESFVLEKREEIQERIDAPTEVLENAQTDLFANRKSLKCAFLCEITNSIGIARDFTPEGEGSISATTFMRDDYDISDWSGD